MIILIDITLRLHSCWYLAAFSHYVDVIAFHYHYYCRFSSISPLHWLPLHIDFGWLIDAIAIIDITDVGDCSLDGFNYWLIIGHLIFQHYWYCHRDIRHYFPPWLRRHLPHFHYFSPAAFCHAYLLRWYFRYVITVSLIASLIRFQLITLMPHIIFRYAIDSISLAAAIRIGHCYFATRHAIVIDIRFSRHDAATTPLPLRHMPLLRCCDTPPPAIAITLIFW